MRLLRDPEDHYCAASTDVRTYIERGPRERRTAGDIDHFGFRLVDKGQLDRATVQVERAGGRLVKRGTHEAGRPNAHVVDPTAT